MNPLELYQAGRLNEAIEALGIELRNNPVDTRRRTFLFELLCFAGELDRARKHLHILSDRNKDSEIGCLVYRAALAAESIRQQLFESGQYRELNASTAPAQRAGTLNGKPFHSLEDADPRLGARFEVFVAGEYMLMPFQGIRSVRVDPPKQLRDLLWASANIASAPSFKDREMGEVLIPAIYPLSCLQPNDAVRLGRSTEWVEDGSEVTPYGQRLLLVDEEEVVPFLEVRELIFETDEPEEPEPAQAQ